MKRIRMVIADDEEIERKALRLLIERTLPQIEVVGEAENGKEAIHLALQQSPQLMTVDIKMPGIDGLEAIREFTKRGLPIKVIIVSAYDAFAYAQEAIRLGVKEYLLKPSKRETIRKTLLRVVEEIMREEKDLQTRRLLEDELHQYKKTFVDHGGFDVRRHSHPVALERSALLVEYHQTRISPSRFLHYFLS